MTRGVDAGMPVLGALSGRCGAVLGWSGDFTAFPRSRFQKGKREKERERKSKGEGRGKEQAKERKRKRILKRKVQVSVAAGRRFIARPGACRHSQLVGCTGHGISRSGFLDPKLLGVLARASHCTYVQGFALDMVARFLIWQAA